MEKIQLPGIPFPTPATGVPMIDSFTKRREVSVGIGKTNKQIRLIGEENEQSRLIGEENEHSRPIGEENECYKMESDLVGKKIEHSKMESDPWSVKNLSQPLSQPQNSI